MAMGVNKVILLGHVGKDPEVRYTPDGMCIVTLSLATGESWKDKKTGEKKENTEWHRVIFFNKLAEIVSEYVKKGTKIFVEGSLKTRKWQDRETGQDRFITEINANGMQLLSSSDHSNDKKSEQIPTEDDFSDIPF